MFLAPWALCPIAIFCLFLTFKDKGGDNPPPFGLADLGRTFWVNPVKFPDFGWAFLSRFLVVMGVAYFLTYQFIFINEHLKLSQAEAIKALTLSQLLTTIVTVSFTFLFGWLSDKMGQRKPAVLIAGLLVALGLLIIATASSMNQFLVGAAIYGVGQGVYFAVDLALVAAVLPDPNDTAKDIGVFNIASAFPQTVAPVIAPVFLGIGAVAGGNLPAVFIAGALMAIVGAFAVLPIKKTR
jgi:MFS family permease